MAKTESSEVPEIVCGLRMKRRKVNSAASVYFGGADSAAAAD